MTKKIIATLIASLSVFAFAADNTIYIDQTGDNANITILQDGASNRVRGIQGVGTGNTTPSKLSGDAITIDVQQIGSGNVLNMGVVTTTANGSSPTSITYVQTGNNATATFDLNNAGTGTNASTTLDITQTGDGGTTTLNILGSNNSMTSLQSGEIGRAHV